MSQRVSIIFPYMTSDPEVFHGLCKTLKVVTNSTSELHDSRGRPLLVVNMDSMNAGCYAEFVTLASSREYNLDLETSVEVLKVWAVDTCQMWLRGFRPHFRSRREGWGRARSLNHRTNPR